MEILLTELFAYLIGYEDAPKWSKLPAKNMGFPFDAGRVKSLSLFLEHGPD